MPPAPSSSRISYGPTRSPRDKSAASSRETWGVTSRARSGDDAEGSVSCGPEDIGAEFPERNMLAHRARSPPCDLVGRSDSIRLLVRSTVVSLHLSISQVGRG